MARYYRVECEGFDARGGGEGCMDMAVCRAESREGAVVQLPPEMRRHVSRVVPCASMRNCYPRPKGILREEVI